MNGMMYQRGMGYWGYMMVVICLIVFGKIGMVTVPAYVEDRALDSMLEDKIKNAGQSTGKQIVSNIQRQLDMNSSGLSAAEIVEVVNGTPGSVVLKKNYDVRHNLFGHVDVVSHFEKEFRQ